MNGERRTDDAVVAAISAQTDAIMAMRKELSDHIASEPADIADAVRAAVGEMVATAFPKGPDGKPDLIGHCGAHQAEIDAYKSRKEFWQKLIFELAKWGLIGFALWTLKAVVEHAAHTLTAATHTIK